MSENASNNKRIARNTVYLYFRTILIMLITLYTSRVILNALGVEDYGVYNAVGGVVSMFAFLTASLSAAISRFITFELGRDSNDTDKLQLIFSTSVRIQVVLSFIILILGEVVGVWFLNSKMNIPPARMMAANWVWQCCLLSFVINLISIPYNALIIAHEHMKAYAIVSILDAALRLAICFLVVFSSYDKLISYAVLTVAVTLIIRIAYGIYCKKNFTECKYVVNRNRELTKNMFGFASYSFLNNTVSIFNHQGINLLVNLFFGVLFNAARGIATQVESAIMQLVNNLTVAINPQITKSYAAADKERMFSLICKGAKYSYYLLLLFALPVFLEAEYILKLWLKIVPDYSVLFLRLTLIGAMVKMLGNTAFTAIMATGDIKKYSVWVTIVGISAFPLTYIFYRNGYSVEYAYYSYIFAYALVEIAKLRLMKTMIGFSPMRFAKDVFLNAIVVTVIATIVPCLLFAQMPNNLTRFIIVVVTSTICVVGAAYYVGMGKTERLHLKSIVSSMLSSKTTVDL